MDRRTPGAQIVDRMRLNRQTLLLEEDLGVAHDLRAKGSQALFFFRRGHASIDGYCPSCGNMTEFHNGERISPARMRMRAEVLGGSPLPMDRDITDLAFTSTLICVRNPEHRNTYDFVVRDRVLRKVGQTPSFAMSRVPWRLRTRQKLARLWRRVPRDRFTLQLHVIVIKVMLLRWLKSLRPRRPGERPDIILYAGQP